MTITSASLVSTLLTQMLFGAGFLLAGLGGGAAFRFIKQGINSVEGFRPAGLSGLLGNLFAFFSRHGREASFAAASADLRKVLAHTFHAGDSNADFPATC